MISQRRSFLQLRRNLVLLPQARRFKKASIEKKGSHENADTFERNKTDGNVPSDNRSHYLTSSSSSSSESSRVVKNNLRVNYASAQMGMDTRQTEINGKENYKNHTSYLNKERTFSSRTQLDGGNALPNGSSTPSRGGTSARSGSNSHLRGSNIPLSGNNSHLRGSNIPLSGSNSHLRGSNIPLSGNNSHLRGSNIPLSGNNSHLRGSNIPLSGNNSHLRGSNIPLSGNNSHLRGSNIPLSGNNSHLRGSNSLLSDNPSGKVGISGYGTNVYMNKLHDYLDISQKSESDKIRINKQLNKLRNENLTIAVILDVLKNLCKIFLKKDSFYIINSMIRIDNYDNPNKKNKSSSNGDVDGDENGSNGSSVSIGSVGSVGSVGSGGNASKKLKKKIEGYFEEYFVSIENYIKNYITFINENDIYKLYKYLYCLNYTLNLEIMELLQEKFYLHIDKFDNIKVAEIYHIIRYFYKNFYLREPDSFLIFAVDEKFKKYYTEGVLYSNTQLQGCINEGKTSTGKGIVNNVGSFSKAEEHTFNSHFGKYFDGTSQGDHAHHKSFPTVNDRYIHDDIHKNGKLNNFFTCSNKRNTHLMYNNVGYQPLNNFTNNHLYITPVEANDLDRMNMQNSNELVLIFKYINNYHHDMNFFYENSVINNVERNLNNMSADLLLLLLNIYINGPNELFSRTILHSLHNNVDNMTESNLMQLTNCLNNSKLCFAKTGECSNKISELNALVKKIVNKVKRDNELIIPDNLAIIYLNLHDIVEKISLPPKLNLVNYEDQCLFGHSKEGENDNSIVNRKEHNDEKIIDESHSMKKSTSIVPRNRADISNFENSTYGKNKHMGEEKTISTNNSQIERITIMREITKFCDDYINNVSSFTSILNLYLIYIKNENIKNKTIQNFEKKIKMNKNKLTKRNISNIILSLSIYPCHYTQMFTYLENVLNEKLTTVCNNNFLQSEKEKVMNNDKENIDELCLTVHANYLIDISLALGISGKKNLNLWKLLNVHKIILTCNKKLLLYLSYSFLLTNYFCTISWFFIIKRIVEEVKGFNKKQYELLYEILKCSILFNYIDLNNFKNNSLKYVNIKNFVNNNYSNKNYENNFMKTFFYLLNTSYYHYKMKLIKNQYISNVPYEDIFIYLKLNYDKNIEYKQLYIIPFLLKDYNVIIDPLPSIPIHKSSGNIMGEIQLKHKVFQYDNYIVLSFYDGMWNEFIKQHNEMEPPTYDIKSLAEHFKTYTESHIKIKINKNNTVPTTFLQNNVKHKTYPHVNYLKYKKTNTIQQQNSTKYLVNKTNTFTGTKDQNRYLKMKTRVVKKKM
ncbi:conserved Plasmodium protein, unknown function [Plasmodium ovale wallikeri]|uniref:Uncharacterized protein n=1 Tax=Plasmodium ovale wallikeri TaxID=864142 RepID=A0A1A8ZVZ2_PLAOA|nr:conserved Plasmodium protein, unknown function [Plasmodium ovale wallikeri]